MFRPAFITFTGADDRTNPARMRDLADDYPVEFAILFSRSREGTPRYPAAGWIDRIRDSGLRIAAHVCGTWAEQIVTDGVSDIDDRLGGFARVQVNTAVEVDPGLVRDWADRAGRLSDQEIEPILQCRGPFPDDPRVSWLFDPSGGRGLWPDDWPAPPRGEIRFGYAGGLGPETIAGALGAIEDHDGGWVDMESRVRDAEDRLDIGLCRKVCEQVYATARNAS